jgi:hypothetical protein
MRELVTCICAVLLANPCFPTDCDDHSLKSLYESRQLFELREAVSNPGPPVFYQGVVACAFNQVPNCERNLKSVIESAPRSTEARQARTTLAGVYFRSGRYRECLAQSNAMLAVNPDDPVKESQPLVQALGKLPNQSVTRSEPSKVALHAWGEDLAIPLRVNGRNATYAFDTGSFAVFVSRSEAKRVGLRLYETDPRATVNGLSVTVALAKDFDIGGFHFKNVAFVVFPDDQEPFKDMPAGERGILGLPTLLAFSNFSWGRDQVFAFGQNLSANYGEPNIAFDEQAVLVRVKHQGTKLTFGLDTGGETTTLERPFAERFAGIVQKTGTKGQKTINEIGSRREIQSIVLPQLELQVGNFPAILRPAHILMNQPDNACHYGSLGMDLMKQSERTTIDFESMTLRMR